MKRLTQKTALITGAQQGIGRAIAEQFAMQGANIIVNWLDDEAAAGEIVDYAVNAGVKAVAVQGNVTQPNDVKAMIAAGDSLGGLDLLVNNAAIFPRVPFVEMTEKQWDDMFDVNLKGVFRCTQPFVQQCISATKPGVVINFSSQAAYRSSPDGAHYVSTKAGVIGLTRALSLELAEHRIRVNAIAPGLTDTAQPRFGMTEDELQTAGRQIPLGRLAQPDDIADMAVFLASNEARFITGQVHHVNGGQFLG